MLTEQEKQWLENRHKEWRSCETCWNAVLKANERFVKRNEYWSEKNGELSVCDECEICMLNPDKTEETDEFDSEYWSSRDWYAWDDDGLDYHLSETGKKAMLEYHREAERNTLRLDTAYHNWQDAAEFEARVCLLVGLSRTPNDCNICPDRNNYETCMADFKRRMGWPCDSAQAAAWFNHKMARLAVEEEMDNDRA